jgi:hypothetical protein
MKPTTPESRHSKRIRHAGLALLAVIVFVPGGRALRAQAKPAAPAAASDTTKATPQELDALVAPIALYPDPLLAQTLVASTYPLEIIQLQQWMAKNPNLKDKALADAVAKQPWDPSIQSMAAIPDVVKRLADDIQWTTALGNAFLSQQSDVQDAVQRMRKKAKDKGSLVSNQQQTVDTQVVEKQTVIVVQPTNPEVIYVPVYSPTVVYGPPVYPYPPIYYPPYPPGAAMVTFAVGVAWGAAIWGGSCCHYGYGGGGGNVYINNSNNFNQINHNNNVGNNNNRPGGGSGNNNWSHNAEHRGGAPYGDSKTASKYGGTSASTRQAGAGAGQGQRTGASTQPAGGGGGGNRAGASTQPAGGAGGGNRAGASTKPTGGSSGQRSPSAGTQPSRSGGYSGSSGGFSGGSGGYSGSSARASSSRGASSMGSRGGGGGGRGGGGRR